MSARVFVDTNVLLYWFDETARAKQQKAGRWLTFLWASGAGRLSWQVLNEFYASGTRRLGIREDLARRTVQQLAQWGPLPPTLPLVERAWMWRDSAQLSFWDALIVAAAEGSGARYLLTEDFQTGRRLGDLTVISPFRTDPEEIAAP